MKLFVFVILCFSSVIEAEDRILCKPYEIYNTCASSCRKEPNCLDRFSIGIVPTYCPTVCVARCECDAKRGYIRSSPNGTCVKKEECPRICPINEISNSCGSSCVPEATCQNRYPTRPFACTLNCVQRCECDTKNGYIRDAITKKCVKIADCKRTCPINEISNQCASSCVPEATCQNRYPTSPKACILKCVQRCECDTKNGYIRDALTKRCVKTTECQKPCPLCEHEGCKPCCEGASCQNRNPKPCTGICPKICIRECQCDNGYLRNKVTGKCVLIKDCPCT